MKTKVFEFNVPGTPIGKARARTVSSGGHVHSFTPMKTKSYEDFIRNCFVLSGGKIFDCPVSVEVAAYFEVPKSYTKKLRNKIFSVKDFPHTKKPDCDNVLKSVLDALNGVAWSDDSKVFEAKISKYYGEKAHISVKIFGKGDDDGEAET